MAQVSIEELKEKFTTVQNINQSLKEEKIRIESELKTLDADYKEQLKELLEKTGTASFEEAVQVYKQKKEELEINMDSLEQELNKYLDTYGEEDNA